MAESLKARSAETFPYIAKLIAVLWLLDCVHFGSSVFRRINNAVERVKPTLDLLEHFLHFVFPYMLSLLIFV